ncbi:MAG: iron-containing alcohol dehydrogenase, partial [Pseudomonadales bacterium]|nr:iron-containing alcohol dehydrogenase [Pseudomonadales bacterium]
LNQGGIGYVHAIAHQLGAVYGVPHGRANAIVLPYILDFNEKASRKRLAELARSIKLVDSNANDLDAANNFITRTKQLIEELNINLVVDKIDDLHFDGIIASAFTEAHGTYAVPKYMSKSHAKSILNSIKQPLATA